MFRAGDNCSYHGMGGAELKRGGAQIYAVARADRRDLIALSDHFGWGLLVFEISAPGEQARIVRPADYDMHAPLFACGE
jgi:hypothetical protein